MSQKVSIIGGAGRVGSSAAYALQLGRSCAEIVLVDAAGEAAQGEALDLTHGRAAVGGPQIRAGDYSAVAGSEVVVVTAGSRRKPDESRLQLTERNVALFRQLIRSVQAAAPEAILLVVTNPVDVLTYLAASELGWPPKQTIGLGTVLDTLRFRSLLGARLNLDASRIEALILGEHGDSMVPIWSRAQVGGVALASCPGFSDALGREVFAEVKAAGAEMIRLKSGAAYAIGLCVRDVVHAIARDARRPLPLSTLQAGAYGIDGTCLSLPTVIGRAGALGVLEPALAAEEVAALQASAQVLRETMAGIA